MITSTQIASMMNITPLRVKQLVWDSDLPVVKSSAKSRTIFPHSTVRKLLQSRGFKFDKTIATIGQEKGGVGKSLLSFNVAVNMAQRGAKVLIVDLDPESCLTNILLTEEDLNNEFGTVYHCLKDNLQFKDVAQATRYEGVDIVGCKGLARRADRLVADGNPKKILSKHMEGLEEYDLILFDVPPTFTRLISSAYLTSDIVVMPTFPDAWSIESLQLTIDDINDDCEQFDSEKPEIKILMNKYRSDRTASKEAWNTLSKEFGQYLLPFQIKESAHLQNLVNEGLSLFEKGSNKDIKEAFISVCDILCPVNSEKQLDQ